MSMSIAVAVDDRRDRVEEGEGVGAGRGADRFGQRASRSAARWRRWSGRRRGGRRPARAPARCWDGAAIRSVTAAAKPSRSTASAEPAGTLCASAAAMISEPSARISAWSRPTALCSASSERKLFEQTSSARPSVWCAGVVSPEPRISRQAHLHAGLGELPGGFRAGEAAADDVDLVCHGRCDSRFGAGRKRG